MNPLDGLQEGISELLTELSGGQVAGSSSFFITQYTVWMAVAAILLLVIVFAAKKRMALVPKGRFVNAIEYVVEWLRSDIGEGVIGAGYEKHLRVPAHAVLLIVLNNLIGLIPGAKPGTGTFSITLALALIVFIYFNYYGFKHQGVGRYIVNLAPRGIGPLYPLVWCIELISLFLRLFTLAVRLFANMYAGHIVMGVFSILTTLFITTAIQSASFMLALPSVAWVLMIVMMYAIEMLVAVIQAYVFTLLTAVYISLATAESH